MLSKKVLLSILLVLMCIAMAAGGYLWQVLNRPLPPRVETAENALFDGNLVGIGLVDVEKSVFLERYWFGGFDPEALPMNGLQQGLMEKLFSGPAEFRDNLGQLLVSLHFVPEEESGEMIWLASGRFDEEALVKTAGEYYTLEKVERGRWKIVGKPKLRSESPCEEEAPASGEQEALYLRLSPEWLLVSGDAEYGEGIWHRLSSAQPAQQDPRPWRAYRSGKLASFMALLPAEAGETLGGFEGMMAKNAAEKNAPLNSLAIGIEPVPTRAGLNANLHLVSDDDEWRRGTASGIEESLEGMKQDSRSFSPTLVDMIAGVEVTQRRETVDIDLLLTSQMLNDLGQVAQEAVGHLFQQAFSDGRGEAEVGERVVESPRDYDEATRFRLAPLAADGHGAPPLFLEEPFAVDLKQVSLTESGVPELWMEGKVGLVNPGDSPVEGELSLSVDSVKDLSGRELLRDERCIDPANLRRSPNHEKATSSTHHRDHGWVWKHIRLAPGTAADQVARIEGEISFSAPTRVRRFAVPLQAGEAVEHAGLRFYLSQARKKAVSYQASGETDRLLELRGLNAAGQVLRQGWSTSTADGRTTQRYEGEVHGLELYIAEEYVRHKSAYVLQDIYAVPEENEKKSFHWFAPERVDPRYWRGLAGLDMERLERDPERTWWDRSGKKVVPVAAGSWAPIRMEVTHEPQERWSYHPEMRLYAPVVEEFRGVLSALSYRLDEPAEEDSPDTRYVEVNYPYRTNTGEVVAGYRVGETPMALRSFSLDTGLEEGQKMERLKGEVLFRFPTESRSSRLDLETLWGGKEIDGVTVTLEDLSRGTFPGYGLKVEGAIEKLVNLHGLSADGERVAASPVNFQDAGYWTMTLPFGVERVELVTATRQEVFRYPFDFEPRYPED